MKLSFILLSFFQLFSVKTNVLADTLSLVVGTKQSITNRAGDPCQEDYSPCECVKNYNENPDSISVSCSSTVESFTAIKEVFQQSTTQRQITLFWMEIPNSEINNMVPSDLLNATATKEIYLSCPNPSNRLLIIDPNTFSASKDSAQLFSITGCDVGRLDYQFLKDFRVIMRHYYFTSINLSASWSSLPYLQSISSITVGNSSDFLGFSQFPISNVPSWSVLSVIECPNFQNLPNTDSLPPIETLAIDGCPLFNQWDVVTRLSKLTYVTLRGFNEETINNALNALASSSLVDQIMTLNLGLNGLRQIPGQIKLFSQLYFVILSSNELTTASNGSLAFATSQLQILDLSTNKLNSFEPAAFEGNFGSSRILLSYNNLSRFESSIFKPILEQMETADGLGYVFIELNPMECDCHLAWLFRDNPNLVDRVVGGTCSNGTSFWSLTAQNFATCAEEIVTTTVTPPTTGGATSITLFHHTSFCVILGIFFLLKLQ